MDSMPTWPVDSVGVVVDAEVRADADIVHDMKRAMRTFAALNRACAIGCAGQRRPTKPY